MHNRGLVERPGWLPWVLFATAAAHDACAGSGVLHDQYAPFSGDYVISVDGSNLSEAADDIQVPAGHRWTIDAVDVRFKQLSGPDTVSFVVRLYANGSDDLPATLVASRTTGVVAPAELVMDPAHLALDPPIQVSAGTWWMSVQAIHEPGTSAYWYWGAHAARVGLSGAWRNPSGAWDVGCLVWTVINACYPADHASDLMFRLYGVQGFASHNGVYHSSPVDHAIAPTSVGTSLNLVSEGIDPTGPLVGDWDLNFWLDDTGALGFFGLDAWNARLLVDDTGAVAALRPGDIVGPASTFAGANGPPTAAAWLAGTEAYAGVRFDCNGRLAVPVDATTCYGYLRVSTTAPSGFPATLVEYAFDGDGQAITIAAQGDVIFCSGFDGNAAPCGAGSEAGIYTTRAQFLENLAPGAFDLPFDDVDAGTSAALEYDHEGTHVIVNTQPGAAGGLYNLPGAVSTLNSGDMLSVHFSGAPVTAVGGNFWATDASFEPSGTSITLYLSDGTVHGFDSGGPDAFRGFVSHVPITYLHIDAPDEGGVTAWSTLDNLVVGYAR